jgi:hypothetical protein
MCVLPAFGVHEPAAFAAVVAVRAQANAAVAMIARRSDRRV